MSETTEEATKEQKHNFALELVRKGQIGAKTYNVIYEYLYGEEEDENQ